MESGDEKPEDQEPEERDRDSEDEPGDEEEKKEQREEDARQAQERLEEVMDAPPEEHPALKADAVGSAIILVGALFVVFGVIVVFAYSPWGWAGVAIGVVDIIIGQWFRRREFRGGDGK